jgi:hypothetical protein
MRSLSIQFLALSCTLALGTSALAQDVVLSASEYDLMKQAGTLPAGARP